MCYLENFKVQVSLDSKAGISEPCLISNREARFSRISAKMNCNSSSPKIGVKILSNKL